ncbi:RMD1, required for meiotic division [Fusarium agapanthi]|uniref:RMD1, required for meiotic division n=1 Tax=Fusarium agapanthi TaxID=1803897 RepID=A0A9P5EEV8_9HYPO|nr:RMD1, required for meiotic division [Fusarium agapanthi]
MRNSSQRITLNVARLFHTSVAGPRLRPHRQFHLTSLASFPRKRSFFTSNPYLSQVDDGSRSASELSKEEKGPASSKRKPTRSNTAKNSLRRVAIIAQQPKRGVTAPGSPSDEPSNVVSATCVAESFKMPIVLEILSSHGFDIDPDGTGFDANEVVHARGVNGGDIFVFPSGTIVTWSLPPDVVTRQIMRAAEEAHTIESREFEDLEFTTDTNREASVLKGDVIVLGTRKEHKEADKLDTTLAKVAFSSGLARSTKLAVLETALTSYFESTRNIPALLSQGAGIPLGRKFILQKTGELLSLRARLNHYSELTDSLPDIFWDTSSDLGLEGYYEQVGRALDVNVRIRALNQKMDYAAEIASVLREMSSEQHGTRLEWIIIVLIAVEVIFELRRIVLEMLQEREERKLAAELPQPVVTPPA